MLLEKSFKILSNIDILVALDKYNDFFIVTFVKCKITCVLSERDKKFRECLDSNPGQLGQKYSEFSES